MCELINLLPTITNSFLTALTTVGVTYVLIEKFKIKQDKFNISQKLISKAFNSQLALFTEEQSIENEKEEKLINKELEHYEEGYKDWLREASDAEKLTSFESKVKFIMDYWMIQLMYRENLILKITQETWEKIFNSYLNHDPKIMICLIEILDRRNIIEKDKILQGTDFAENNLL